MNNQEYNWLCNRKKSEFINSAYQIGKQKVRGSGSKRVWETEKFTMRKAGEKRGSN